MQALRRHERRGIEVSVIHAPVFLATKLEAYGDRGHGDSLSSKDVEDIIALLDGRPQLLQELKDPPREMQEFIQERLSRLRDDPSFAYAVEGYLAEAPSRASTVYERMESIIEGN